MKEYLKYIVTKEDEAREFSIKELLSLRFNISSRMRRNIKKNKAVRLNNEYSPIWICPKKGDIITLDLPKETSYFEPEDIPISIIFEDEHLMVINKSPGFISHPTHGHPSGTIANGIAQLMNDRNEHFKIRFVNRLDRDTSGLLILAKDSHSQHIITNQMKDNKIKKEYEAIVWGELPSSNGTIDLPLRRGDGTNLRRMVRPDGARSITHFEVLKYYNGFSKVKLLLETGRTHQIRVHMSHIGHPLVGDVLYGGSMYLDKSMPPVDAETGLPPYREYIPEAEKGKESLWLLGRQALHACHLEFFHPISNKLLKLDAPLPEDILKLEHQLKKL